jgi:predicted HTH transcriptional regulator
MAESIGVSSRTVEKHIAKLKKAGIIERVGSRKEGKWKVNK